MGKELTEQESWYTQNRARVLQAARQRYESDPVFREAMRAASRQRYHTDPAYRASVIARSKAQKKARSEVGTTPPTENVIHDADAAGRPRTPGRRGPKPDPIRLRAVTKLRWGIGPLTVEELERVPVAVRAEVAEVRQRTLAEVAAIFGISRERVRQIVGPVSRGREPPDETTGKTAGV